MARPRPSSRFAAHGTSTHYPWTTQKRPRSSSRACPLVRVGFMVEIDAEILTIPAGLTVVEIDKPKKK